MSFYCVRVQSRVSYFISFPLICDMFRLSILLIFLWLCQFLGVLVWYCFRMFFNFSLSDLFHLTQLHSYFSWVLGKNVTEVRCLFCYIMWREYMISAFITGDICHENWKEVGETFCFFILCILEVTCQFQPTLMVLGVKLHPLEGGIYIYYLEFFCKENLFIILLLNMSVWPHKYLYIQL